MCYSQEKHLESQTGDIFSESTFSVQKQWIYLYKRLDHERETYIEHLAGKNGRDHVVLLTSLLKPQPFGIYFIDSQEKNAFL